METKKPCLFISINKRAKQFLLSSGTVYDKHIYHTSDTGPTAS